MQDFSAIEKAVFTDEEILEARHRLWEVGELYWKLQPCQKSMYDFLKGKQSTLLTLNCSRRIGKTTILMILALEECNKFEKRKVKFIQPEVGMIRKNIIPDLEQLLIDCPAHLRPKFQSQDNKYIFPNGSEIQLVGTDNKNYEKLRGSNADLALIDEAGFCTDLDHIIRYILMPTTLITKGRIILASTTPTDPSHEFVEYMKAAKENGTILVKTILDAIEDNRDYPDAIVNDELLQRQLENTPGGMESDSFKTEFLCQLIYNSDDSVVPEFTPEVESQIATPWLRPPYADTYVAMDLGFSDNTALLFGYFDFINAVLVIEDEIVIKGKEVTAKFVSELVTLKEKELWRDKLTGEVTPAYKRISDNNLIFLNDLMLTYNMYFMPTEKHNKNEYINKLRTMIADRRIIINPKCTHLLSDLRNAIWDKSKKDFKRSANGGHRDCLAALMYLVRNLDESRNPFPAGYNYMQTLKNSRDNVFFSENYYKNKTSKGLEGLAQKLRPKSSLGRKKG